MEIKFEKLFENGSFEIIWELELWKLNLRIWVLEIKFERNWSIENCLRIGVLKIKLWKWELGNYFKMEVVKIGILKNYLKIKVLKIGILKIIWKWKFWKLNLKIEILEIGNQIWKSESKHIFK